MSAVHQIDVVSNATNNSFPCAEDQNILVAMQKAGLAVVPVGCRGGGCGVCKIEIVEGRGFYGKMSRAHISELQEAKGSYALACKLFPRTKLRICPIGQLFKKINQPAPTSANSKRR